MGYVCPVCEDPQADADHLANHLAFTAILGDEAHERWLEDTVPGWDQLGESELAAELTQHVEETEFPQVFEDTVDRGRDADDRSGALFDDPGADPGGVETPTTPDGFDATDPETRAIIEEAREMTEAMLEDPDDSEQGREPVDDDGEAEHEQDKNV
ncbi:MAG: DUF5810 domain-containing protein [Natronomonas sp.]